ncbi:MAG: InlB B-repeat-containing protein [Candidatus Methanomethylophilaceae archaeon]
MPAEDLTVIALWTANTYTIRLDPNSGTGSMEPMSMTYDQPKDIPKCTFERTGYSFIGWSDSSTGQLKFNDCVSVMNMATGAEGDTETVLYALWGANIYTVTLDPNGGTGEEVVFPITYDSDTRIPGNTFALTGHSFAGWSLSRDGDVCRTDNSEADNLIPEGSVTLFAIWAVNSYTIRFADTGDTVQKDICQTYGSDITVPADPSKRGHTFVRWDPAVPGTMPAEDMVIRGVWAVNDYGISFTDCDLTSFRLDYGSAVSIADPERYGYSFSGWDIDVPDTMPDRDLVLCASWSPRTIPLVFEGYPDIVKEVRFDSAFGTLPEAEKGGYDFRGWYYDPELTRPVSSDDMVRTMDIPSLHASFMKVWVLSVDADAPHRGTVTGTGVFDTGTSARISAEPREGYAFIRWSDDVYDIDRELLMDRDIDLTAVFSPVRRVTFDTNGGPSLEGLDVPAGCTFAIPEYRCTVEGMYLAGWTDGLHRYASDTVLTMAPYDITLKAVWRPAEHTATFRMHDADVSVSSAVGYPIRVPEVSDRDGYRFAGWSPEVPDVMPDVDMVFTALWELITVRYVFDTCGGTPIDDMVLCPGSSVPDVADPVRKGYLFIGWDGSIPDVCGMSDMTFMTVWRPGTYTMFFDTGDGSPMQSIAGTYGSDVLIPDDPVRKGHRFSGWSPSPGDTIPFEDTVYTAVWERNMYSVIFGGGCDTVTVTGYYGDPVDVPDGTGDREGYVLRGWTSAVPETFPDHDTVILGIWDPMTFSVTFDMGDGSSVRMDAECGSPIPEIDVPVSEGKVFSGWSQVPERMPAHDIVIHAVWHIPLYHMVFVSCGVTVSDMYAGYGTDLTAPSLESDCMLHMGWVPEVPDTVPASDMTFRAVWSPIPEGNVFRCDAEVMSVSSPDGIVRAERKGMWMAEFVPSGESTVSVDRIGTENGSAVYRVDVSGRVDDVRIWVPYACAEGSSLDVLVRSPSGTYTVEGTSVMHDGTSYAELTVPSDCTFLVSGISDDTIAESLVLTDILLAVMAVTITLMFWRLLPKNRL